MSLPIEAAAPVRLAEADLSPRGSVHPSPIDWRDQVFYQLLPDRFSDGREAKRPLYDPSRPDEYRAEDKVAWMAAGNSFVGGTLSGIRSKLDYLQGLGVTTLWISPPFKQRADLATYHGYGIQNFLDIDPRFGTRQDLRELVDAAHERGMYVVLDVIYNYSGNNFYYRNEQTGLPEAMMPYRFEPPYPIHGWRSATGESIPKPITPEDGVWPEELQNPDFYTRAGAIGRWGLDYWEDALHPDVEFRRGDYYDLKCFDLQRDDVVLALARIYQYWIAVSDCDGFRMDAVKHISARQSQLFCTAIQEYAQAIGKDNFLLIGEVSEGRIAPSYEDYFDRTLDAVLGIIAYPNRLNDLVKGLDHPDGFFALYTQETLGAEFRRLGRYVVNIIDDYDMSSRAYKARLGADSRSPNLDWQVAHATGMQLTMPGIPSIYYGTEQALDGSEAYHDYDVEPQRYFEDRYVREAMFGGAFGAFGTEGCHFFNPDHPTYVRIAAIARLRNGDDAIGRTLRRGTLYVRETSFDSHDFGLHGPGEIVGWSQVLFDTEVLMALNANAEAERSAAITVDANLHPPGTEMRVLYDGAWSDEVLREGNRSPSRMLAASGKVSEVDGRAVVHVELPPSGMVILS
jgi:glycosidase